MVLHLGEEYINDIYERKNKNKIYIDPDSLNPSRFIIPPNHRLKMHWGNFILIQTIIYVFLLPMFVSFAPILSRDNLNMLIVFDLFFMIDRFLNLFVGFYNKEGEYEPKVMVVIMKNYSSDFYMELVYTFSPFFFEPHKLNSIYYFLFKIPRYNRLFEIGTAANTFLEYYGQNWNVFEVRQVEKKIELYQFMIQTLNMIHLLTCTQIMLCIHRDYSKSWLGENGKDVP